MGRLRLFQLMAVLTLMICLPPGIHAQTSDLKITPQMLGLPDGNARTAEPYQTRVYPTDDNGNPIRSGLGKFDKSYPIIVDKEPGKRYKLDEKEAAVFHGALDLSSRPAPGKAPVPLDFKAGVYGTVLRARGTDGVILVQLPNGNIIHYLHTSEANVEPGQKVTPNTVLGKTGNVGTGTIHLHLQATDPKGKLIDIDKAFLAGRKPDLWTPVDWKAKHWVDFKPDYQTLPKPKVVDGVVKAATRIIYDDDAPKEKTRERLAGTVWRNRTEEGTLWEDVLVFQNGGVLQAKSGLINGRYRTPGVPEPESKVVAREMLDDNGKWEVTPEGEVTIEYRYLGKENTPGKFTVHIRGDQMKLEYAPGKFMPKTYKLLPKELGQMYEK